MNMLVDTGAALMIISKEPWDKSKASGVQLESSAEKKLVGEQGIPLQLHGVIEIN